MAKEYVIEFDEHIWRGQGAWVLWEKIEGTLNFARNHSSESKTPTECFKYMDCSAGLNYKRKFLIVVE